MLISPLIYDPNDVLIAPDERLFSAFLHPQHLGDLSPYTVGANISRARFDLNKNFLHNMPLTCERGWWQYYAVTVESRMDLQQVINNIKIMLFDYNGSIATSEIVRLPNIRPTTALGFRLPASRDIYHISMIYCCEIDGIEPMRKHDDAESFQPYPDLSWMTDEMYFWHTHYAQVDNPMQYVGSMHQPRPFGRRTPESFDNGIPRDVVADITCASLPEITDDLLNRPNRKDYTSRMLNAPDMAMPFF